MLEIFKIDGRMYKDVLYFRPYAYYKRLLTQDKYVSGDLVNTKNQVLISGTSFSFEVRKNPTAKIIKLT